MKPNDCVKILELMASKVCHDLISPIGAVSNGIEFLEDAGEEMDGEAIKLISFSATQASAKLKVFRLAYGAGGSDPSIKPEDVHKSFGDYIAGDGRITQNWDPHKPLGLTDPPAGLCKIIMCLLLVLVDTLPKGGVVAAIDGGDGTLHFKSTGDHAGFREGYKEALTGSAKTQNLEPKTIHPALTNLLATHYGYSIHVLESPEGSILLSLRAA